MIVSPYRRPPEPPTVALLEPSGFVVDEHGSRLLHVPYGVRVFAPWETVWRLTREGMGEALCWNNEEIRWRRKPRPGEADWVNRHDDVFVLKPLPDPDTGVSSETILAGVARWRDWLAGFGAAPTGTTGSTSMSLLRATVGRKLVTGSGVRPPLVQTLGGRQQLGARGAGTFRRCVLHDLEAAYASTLAGLWYGGLWQRVDDLEDAERYARRDLPVFVHARVTIPDMAFGPLPRRPRRRMRTYLEAHLFGVEYPTGCRITGTWTWQELQGAAAAGCTIRFMEAWVHRSAWQPFLPWWSAVTTGRGMPGVAGVLAKATGNALWGRFAMDPHGGGRRTIRGRKAGGRMAQRVLRGRPFMFPAHDLAETVSGRVRAELFDAMVSAGDRLVSAHTDGLWVDDRELTVGERWRVKEKTIRLDVLGPQTLRYWSGDNVRVVYSGVPAVVAEDFFQRDWERANGTGLYDPAEDYIAGADGERLSVTARRDEMGAEVAA